jgi:transketolase
MNEQKNERLRALAHAVREHIIRMTAGGGCFIGASLSCADLIVYCYAEFLRISPRRLDDPERDYLLLSKGHDVPALYGTLAELGYIPKERLRNHLSPDDRLYWHPNCAVPGIEFHAGSLGHLLPLSVGIALDCSIRQLPNRIVVITGDGELNEGSNWEALLLAQANALDNLTVIVDRNEFQANIRTEELIPLEPLETKFQAFGCATARIDGHDFAAMDAVMHKLPLEQGKPSVIVADTVRGKGLPSIERRADRWFCSFTPDEIEQLLAELRGERGANLTSSSRIVR